jgi:hypothetical protein
MGPLLDKLHATWLAAGHANEEFLQRVGSSSDLHSHEEHLVQRAGITLPKSLLRAMKSILGEQIFDETLSCLKSHAIEPAALRIHNPDGLLIYRACEAIRRNGVLPRPEPLSASAKKAR